MEQNPQDVPSALTMQRSYSILPEVFKEKYSIVTINLLC